MRILKAIHMRALVLVVVGAIAVSVGASFAWAATNATTKTPLIGSGIAVVNTNLAYQNASAAGTGIVLTSNGEVLTNNHVIAGATTIKVVFPGTGHSYAATVVGYSRTADVALLQLKSAKNLKTATTGTATKLKVGSVVTASGNAGGTGRITSVRGTVTGLNKSITASDDNGSSEQLTNLIETNAAIQPGDSGGPLLDSSGKVVGMDTAGSTGFSFASRATDAYAIPIGKALAVVKAIRAGASSATIHVGGTAFLGIQVQETPEGGALVAAVVGGGPAEQAGLVAGDTITAIDGQTIDSPDDVASYVLGQTPGATATVTYVDQTGVEQTATVTLGSGPAQ